MSSSASSAPPRLNKMLPLLRRIFFPDWLLNRRVRITRPGFAFLFLIVAVAGAAFNTGNNLLYLVLSMMLAAMLASFMVSEYVIAQVRVERAAPEFVTAGVSFRVTYRFKNEKKLIPSFAVCVNESLGSVELMAIAAFVGAGKETVIKASAIAPERGRIRFHDMTISTTAPFGWFDKRKRVPLEGGLIALPRADSSEVDRDQIAARGEERPVHKAGRGDQLFGFRQYTRGDPVKDIHWKTSARTGGLMVRVRESEEERKLRIALNLSAPRPESPEPLREAAVRRAAALARAAIEDGWQVRVEHQARGVDFGHGPAHLHDVLVFLALFDDPASPAGEPLPAAAGPAVSIP
ncbi:MAG TPA: DUF58 domain-containing protein [bacterium]|nr:DUF58 domain-containing protein [bacterium]